MTGWRISEWERILSPIFVKGYGLLLLAKIQNFVSALVYSDELPLHFGVSLLHVSTEQLPTCLEYHIQLYV